MTGLLQYNTNSEWLNQISNDHTIDNMIDYFFTQRRVNEVEEIIDDKTLERKTKKSNKIYNFLAINIPAIQFKNISNLIIDIEIWGDDKFNFKGLIIKKDGEIPDLLLKLKEDKTIFVKLIFKERINDVDKNLKTCISFIPVIKRYQMVPVDI